MTATTERNPKSAYELLTSDQLKELRQAFRHDMVYRVDPTDKESVLFGNTRIAIIDQILKERGDENEDR